MRPSEAADDAAVEETLRRMPPFLYKYSGISQPRLGRMRELIVDSLLYFPSPSSFNDPFDCRLPVDFRAPAHVIEQYWRRWVREAYPGLTARQYRPRIQQKIHEARTPAGQKNQLEAFWRTLYANGIVCLAKDPASTLMWSYYAEGHRGIAIRFNTTIENLPWITANFFPLEVRYQAEFPYINFYRTSDYERIARALGTKSLAWEHEGEWRFVRKCFGYLSVPPAMIDGVVLGLRTSAQDEASIRGWLAHRSPKIELLRVKNCPNSFNLQVAPADTAVSAHL